MRPWIEKLAKISKEKGIFRHLHIIINDLEWDIDYFTKYHERCNCHLCIKHVINDNNYQTTHFKLYDDEVDLLNEVIIHCENKARDYILNKIEILK